MDKQFFQENGFEKIIDKFDFPSDTEELGWGYSDEALFQKVLSTLPTLKEPFCFSPNDYKSSSI